MDSWYACKQRWYKPDEPLVSEPNERNYKPMKRNHKLAYTALYFIATSIVILTIYLATLGWPVAQYKLVKSWTGTEPNMMIEVLQFNECLNPLPMKDME